MFRKQNDQQQEPKDESVRQEAQLEEQNSIQPMGNEAMNAVLMNQMLREANDDNMLDVDENIGEGSGDNIIRNDGPDNIINENHINDIIRLNNDNRNNNIIYNFNSRIPQGGMRESDE